MFDHGERGISAGTLSKPFGLPGLRIDGIMAPPDLVQQCWGMRDYVSLRPGKSPNSLPRRTACGLKHQSKLVNARLA
jgi:aspartate/methionine/tyrosine aminotransferase